MNLKKIENLFYLFLSFANYFFIRYKNFKKFIFKSDEEIYFNAFETCISSKRLFI